MSARPLLTDSQPIKYDYRAGDRILARVSSHLNAEDYHKIVRAITKYIREAVRVIVVDCSSLRIDWIHNGNVDCLASPKHIQDKSIHCGVANLDCSVTELESGDKLVVTLLKKGHSDVQKQKCHDWIQQWAGKDVEIIVLEGVSNCG